MRPVALASTGTSDLAGLVCGKSVPPGRTGGSHTASATGTGLP